MKSIIILLLLGTSCFATSPRLGEVQPIEEKNEFLETAKRISKLSAIAERQVREKYEISSEKVLVLYAFHIAYGDNYRPPEPDAAPFFLFYFGDKNSIGYVKQEDVGEFTPLPIETYTISYRVAINLEEETVRIIDIVQEETKPNQSEQDNPITRP
ncbi:MAG: hypothetical protein ACSHX8_15025 [Opitutaceae bacterium]